MATSWSYYPATYLTATRAVLVNEVRAAIDAAGARPAGGWTDGNVVTSATAIRAKHALEIAGAVQLLRNRRGLGLLPRWTSGTTPGGGSAGTTDTHFRADDINDVRRWFNQYETWGDLRGVHWFNAGKTDLPRVGWNIETVIGVTDGDGNYNSGGVTSALSSCQAARNYGLTNIVRLDASPGVAVPTSSSDYQTWRGRFNTAVNTLKDAATIFIVGNEPTIEGGMSGATYAAAFNNLFPTKVSDTSYLAAGPGVWSQSSVGTPEVDTAWLANASAAITNLDGWALHAYGSPYLQYADAGGDHCAALCTNPREICRVSCSQGTTLSGDASFRRFRDQYIEAIRGRWAAKPVYLTETNTAGLDHGSQPGQGAPSSSYVTGWMQNAYRAVRDYNTDTNSMRSQYPPVVALAWFVDEGRGGDWTDYALSNTSQSKLVQARADLVAADTSTGIT